MEKIRVTFPAEIDPIDVQYTIMAAMKQNADVICNVEYIGISGMEKSYDISAETNADFYMIGMIAAALLRHYES